MKYKTGDKVRIVDEIPRLKIHTQYGPVDIDRSWLKKWLGKVVTIDFAKDGSYTTLEIKGYVLTDEIIKEKVSNDEALEEEITEGEAAFMEMMAEDPGEISDGYHTFNELYEYRLLYNASMFNELAKQNLYDVHKSRLHSDGTVPFDNPDYFIVVAELPTGQISNHYKMKDWDLFDIPVKDKANKYDGHSPKDVAERLRKFLTPKPKWPKTYEECCYVLGFENTEMCFEDDYRDINPPKEQWKRLGLMNQLNKLLICRDAYWKIAGEEMKLGKPWEPDWLDDTAHKFIIHTIKDKIHCGASLVKNHLLAFPTEEMRDAYKENFDPDIEKCKLLL